VHKEALDDPLVASRWQSAVARDVAAALGRPDPDELRREPAARGQEPLF